jgi:ComF family protein
MRFGSISLALPLEMLAAVLAPPRCAACDGRVALLAAFCPDCARAVLPPDPPATPCLAAFAYGGPIARAVARLKYEQRPDLARPLGDLLAARIAREAAALRAPVVVPVPLHPRRLAERGYNQSALLARRVARHLGGVPRALALARVRDTQPQATLGAAARRSAVAGAFEARHPRQVAGQAVILVDDVCTTGATLDACTLVLVRAGAASVTRAVVASTAKSSMRADANAQRELS